MAKLIPAAVFVVILVWTLMAPEIRTPISVNELIWLGLITLASALGATGSIEVAKRLLLLRGVYQERAFRRWVLSGVEVDGSRIGRNARGFARMWANRAEGQFLALAGIESREVELGMVRPTFLARVYHFSSAAELFDLPSEQFAAQLADACDRAVADPDQYRELAAGAAGKEQEDVAAALTRLSELKSSRIHVATRRPLSGGKVLPEVDNAREDLQLAQNRAFAVAQKRVQAYQISTSRGWKRVLSVATLVLCSVLAWATTELTFPNIAGLALLFGLLISPPIAWFVRDIAAGVERWRGISS